MAAPWVASIVGAVADMLIKSETSWIADGVRDLTQLSLALGVAALVIWHRERFEGRPADPALLTRTATDLFRIGWEARAAAEAQDGGKVVQLYPQIDGRQMITWTPPSRRETDSNRS